MTTFSTSIAASSDDAAQVGSTVTLTGTSIGLYGTTYYSGLRFQNVTIPKGATITNAYITLINSPDDDPKLDIYAEATDDATTFTTASNNISGRTRTTAKTNWNVTNLGAWTTNNTPDIKSVIQEITDRSGWSSGNDLNIIFVGLASCIYSFSAYDIGTNYPAITIEYTTEGGGPARERVVYLSGGIEVYP